MTQSCFCQTSEGSGADRSAGESRIHTPVEGQLTQPEAAWETFSEAGTHAGEALTTPPTAPMIRDLWIRPPAGRRPCLFRVSELTCWGNQEQRRPVRYRVSGKNTWKKQRGVAYVFILSSLVVVFD